MQLVIDFFLIGGIVINILILWLLFKSKKELPQKLLILFFGILFLHILHAYSMIHKVKFLYAFTFVFNDVIEFFIGPLIYVYIKSLFENNKTLLQKNWMHFIPAILYLFFISIPFLISLFRDEYIFNYLEFLNENSLILFSVLMVYLIVYILCAFKLVRKYSKAMEANFSTIDKDDFNWVKQMLRICLVVCTIDLGINIYEIITGNEYDGVNPVILFLIVAMIFYLGYYGVRQSKVLLPEFLIKDIAHLNTNTSPSQTISKATRNEFNELQLKLETVFLEQKPYLDEDLTLNKLAQLIPTTDKKLSMLLNQYMDTTFYDLVNSYRIEAVKTKLQSEDFENYTLLGIAFESGFKSKTSFNRIFKKETGMSPSAYKKSL